ncbi:hypothetical protein KC349_g5379 [Hortaea werneckii]|nr:hypothetical protein KC349_g5379 [Hortaea werneckii]
MDVVQDWAAYLLNDADLSHAPYLYRLYSAAGTAKSWLLPLIDQVSQKPDLATIALLLIIVLVSLKILDMLWQTLLFWMRLRIWQNGPSACQEMASSESSSEAPSEDSTKECNGPSTRRILASNNSSSEDLSEHLAQEHNGPSTRETVASSESSSEEHSEHSAEEQTCSEEEHEAVMRDWRLAESFQELLDLNRKFLRGESKRSCYHSAPIFDETVALVPGLLRLHDYGMLTMESQPGTAPPPTWTKCPCCSDERWVQTQQRPFLMFIIPYRDKLPEDVIRRFLVELLIDNDFYAHIWRDEGSCRWRKCRKNIRTASSFPQDWATHTRKEAQKKEDLASAEPRHQQLLDLQCGCETEIFATYDDVMEEASPLLVRVLAKSWEETDLQALVENAAIRAGVQPLYADATDE